MSDKSAIADAAEKVGPPGVTSAFLEKAFWLCGNFPGGCRRSYFGQWLICCLQKTGDKTEDNAAKRAAVARILKYLELPQRGNFEDELIRFVKNFSQCAPVRLRECSSRIESGTDWGRTYQKSLSESSGRLCSFVNYSRKHELDHVTRNSLVLLAWEMARELRNFASLIDGVGAGDAFAGMAKGFLDRARRLEALNRDCGCLPQRYNHERMDHALRRTSEGRRLADNIANWIFIPEWNFRIGDRDHAGAGWLLEDLRGQINDNDLFEIVAIVSSIKALTAMGFGITGCDINDAKPVITLRNGDVFCQVRKNFDRQIGGVRDRLIHFRTVGDNNPTGLQPDIVYKFWREGGGGKPVHLIGDAKNYGSGDNSNVNYPAALFAMMHYLIAFRDELRIENVISFLDGVPEVKSYRRIVLFFFKPQQTRNGDKKYPQPGENDKWHPVLFVYGPDAQKDSEEKNNDALKDFFQAAIDELTK